MEGFAERALGQFPLSVATSLALESLCGIHPDHSHPSPPLQRHSNFWINVKTLYRNLHGALEKGFSSTATPVGLAETLIEEMETIKKLVEEYSNGRCHVVYYLSNYEGMQKKYPHASVRLDVTEKAKMFTAVYTKTIEAVNRLHPDHGIKLFKLKLEPEGRPEALILTHVPYDLLSEKAFHSLTLIESHTGHLKEKGQWSSKYYEGKELTRIPFREDLIQVFGDKETFHPMASKLRKELLELAEQYRWTAITTRDKIAYSIEHLAHPYTRDVLKSMLV